MSLVDYKEKIGRKMQSGAEIPKRAAHRAFRKAMRNFAWVCEMQFSHKSTISDGNFEQISNMGFSQGYAKISHAHAKLNGSTTYCLFLVDFA